MLELQQKERVRSAGVSNFGVDHLEVLKNSRRPMLSVNQIGLRPWSQNTDIINCCRMNGIVSMVYLLFARASVLNDPYLRQLNQKYQGTSAQILLR
ncbi:unnamed protein product [Didymodactylos carnosus]|uniref:NADP-dependent oxidoreductase domain-containing protein n=1 Tax=Didymodactylos carnosus TaxID=1234261 RepID=A0A813TCY3_9BILA|nr:unnamed protein product [Didymodactylos carnosus]CAF3593080.1 unnamed protein product [Didymodactylos carnosus]